MRNRSVIYLIALLIIGIAPDFAQRTSREIKQKERELQRLRTEIQAYEKKLKESEKKERTTLEYLDDLERQSILIRQLIKKLRDEEIEMTAEIDTVKASIGVLENRLLFLQSHYANYVRTVYKHGRVYDLELLFSSKSINQLYIRIQYLKRFSEQRAKDLQSIGENKIVLEQKNEQLQAKLQSERKLLAEKTREEGSLKQTFSERQAVLKRIRKNKRTYQKELGRKTEAFRQIEKLIADLIEKERIQKEREEAERRERELAEAREREKLTSIPPAVAKPNDARLASAFEYQRGKLRWPVAHGSIAFWQSNPSGFKDGHTKHGDRYSRSRRFKRLCRCRRRGIGAVVYSRFRERSHSQPLQWIPHGIRASLGCLGFGIATHKCGNDHCKKRRYGSGSDFALRNLERSRKAKSGNLACAKMRKNLLANLVDKLLPADLQGNTVDGKRFLHRRIGKI
jgi:septal ring factor EnvC (AmiA/AmiB activator)